MKQKTNRKSNFKDDSKFKFNKKRISKSAKKWNPTAEEVGTDSRKLAFGAPINDIKWYRDNEQLLNDVCRLPYNIPVGLPFDRDGGLFYPRRTSWSVPGIVAMDVVPTYGRCSNPSDPVNVAFNGMFTFIRAHTSSKFDWDANTLGINMLATDSMYWTVKWYTRLYATLPLFHASNKYLCRDLIEAQGIDYDDFLAHAADFRSQLNMRIERINALKIPSEIYVFSRHEWLFENYYIEGPATKDQIYMYRPAAYYIHELDSNGLPILTCHRYLAGGSGVGGRLTASDLIRKLDAMLDPVFNDQYFNLISGYIEQAYEGKVMRLAPLPDQMVVPLIYSEEVLLQFKNAKTHLVKHASSGSGYADGSFDLIQGTYSATDPRLCLKSTVSANALMAYRSYNDGTAYYIDSSSSTGDQYNFFAIANEQNKRVMLTSPHAEVTSEENMINTRLIPIIQWSGDYTVDPSVTLTALEYGTEWPIQIEIFTRYYDSVTDSYGLSDVKSNYAMHWNVNATNAYNLITLLLPMYSKYKYLPELNLTVRLGSTSTDPTNVGPSEMNFFELDNYALIPYESIAMIHQSAELAMLRVPEIASTALSAR